VSAKGRGVGRGKGLWRAEHHGDSEGEEANCIVYGIHDQAGSLISYDFLYCSSRAPSSYFFLYMPALGSLYLDCFQVHIVLLTYLNPSSLACSFSHGGTL